MKVKYNKIEQNQNAFSLQSILDLGISILLLLITITVKDIYLVNFSGILGLFECALWNSQGILWALFVSSTWNIVAMSFESQVEFQIRHLSLEKMTLLKLCC